MHQPVSRRFNTKLRYSGLNPSGYDSTACGDLILDKSSDGLQWQVSIRALGRRAIRREDQAGILFDMGLGLKQIDFCVRTADAELIAVLRANEGCSVFGPQSTAMASVLRHHPHRVALSTIGRAEVYQKIGGPETGGVSPAGPHTHVLPQLLKSGRTHSANAPIPVGLVPCGHLHPGNPVIDPLGRDRPFDPQLHADFQALLKRFGPAEYVAAKADIMQAVGNASDPAEYPSPAGRHARTALRIALRQMARRAEHAGEDLHVETIARWRARLDPVEPDDDMDDDSPGH